MSAESKSASPIRVSIVEDDPEIRQHLAFLLGKDGRVSCASQHPSAEDALRQLPATRPQVVLMDINLPGISGIECVEQLKRLLPEAHTIMLTVHEDSESIFQSILAGATGYLLKRTPSAELVSAIQDVVRGGSPMTSSIARKVVQHISQQKPGASASPEIASLTDRERAVLDLLAQGLLYKEIGHKLGIQIDTVRNHIRAIYDKLQVHSRTEAVAKFLKKSG